VGMGASPRKDAATKGGRPPAERGKGGDAGGGEKNKLCPRGTSCRGEICLTSNPRRNRRIGFIHGGGRVSAQEGEPPKKDCSLFTKGRVPWKRGDAREEIKKRSLLILKD